jgi:hypothetical protein
MGRALAWREILAADGSKYNAQGGLADEQK